MLRRFLGKEDQKRRQSTESADSTEIAGLSFSEEQRERKKTEFLKWLRVTGRVNRACDIVGIGRRTVYEWKSEDPQFREAWIAAKAAARESRVEQLEEAAYERAIKRSDSMLRFMLKAEKPEKYSDNPEVERPVMLIWDVDVPGESRPDKAIGAAFKQR